MYCQNRVLLLRQIMDDDFAKRRKGFTQPACNQLELFEAVTLFLAVRDLDDLRGALKPDAGGRTQRGDIGALRRRMAEDAGREG